MQHLACQCAGLAGAYAGSNCMPFERLWRHHKGTALQPFALSPCVLFRTQILKHKIMTNNKCNIIIVCAVSVVLSACTSFRAETTKDYIDPKLQVPVKEHTLAKARSFFDSKSGLNKLKNSITTTTSGTTVGELNQESSGSNAVQVVKIVVETVAPPIKALVP